MAELDALLTGLPKFLGYLVVSLALAFAFVAIYVRATPWAEIELTRRGNTAAALSFGGAFLGFCLPLAHTVAQSVSKVDLALWAAVALIVQIAAHWLCRVLLPDLRGRIESGQIASGVLTAALSIGVGLLNAACLTY